ncbi:MAG: hypothetical protein H0T65_21295, partial [Deltaproteobacteria bacterium]|nr:hypothetical protein [Deltaproteobacteria bacterium]
MVRLLIVFALVACTRTSEKYCGLHPEDLANCPQQDAGLLSCASDPECPGEKPRCLLEGGTGRCVGCIDNVDCTLPGRQSCDAETRTCRSCIEHADCTATNVCLPEGTCGDSSRVIYVDGTNGTDAGDCAFAAPCKTITFALDLVTDTRFFMKLSGELRESVVVNSQYVVILAGPGTKLVGVGDPAFKVQKATVNLYDLEIACESTISGFKSEM